DKRFTAWAPVERTTRPDRRHCIRYHAKDGRCGQRRDTRVATGETTLWPNGGAPRGAGDALRKCVNIFRVSLIERLAYRGDFLIGTVLRFFPVVTTILLWEAVYESSGREELGGLDRREMIAYLLLIHISRMFSSMPGLAGGISRDIREGTLKKYLVQ